MENSTQKEDEKYIEKIRQKMQFCLSMLQDTLFSDNWFINPESNVLKPFLHKSDLETYIKKYKSSQSQALKKIIFDHTMWFAIYVVSFKFTKYYKICKDPQEWISFALEHLWQCIDNYSSDKNTSFETYFINDITFRSKGYIEYMCNYDGTMTIHVDAKICTEQISNMVKTKYAKTDRDYIIWKEYVVNGNKTLQEIGDQYGLTRERIRQIVYRIHKRLKNNPKVKEIFEAYNS